MVKITEVTDQKFDEKLPYDVTEDLIIYMRNDPMFYRKHLYPAFIDVQEAVKKGGKYNKRQLIPVIEKAIQGYVNKFNIKKLPEELMSEQEKLECVSRLLADEQENFKKGSY
jgi:hypothetical protein